MEKDSWSDLTICEIENHLKCLHTRIPVLEKRLKWICSRGKRRGSDLKISMTDRANSKHLLLIEVEQYASGKLREKVRRWAKRHGGTNDTTTVVISLVLQALRNRLVNEFVREKIVADMIWSNYFRMFPGSGDGKIPEELKSFITAWVEQKI